jgi:uncharacterized protein
MTFKTPNPASLGLAGFALTTWLLSMINASTNAATVAAVPVSAAHNLQGS